VEAILDGLFAQAVVIVESEGDREVYQAASEAVKDYAAREVHFVHCGGTGGFLEILRFYRTLNIPVAVIADLDTLADVTKVSEAVRVLSAGGTGDEGFVRDLRELVNDINQLPPAPTPEDVKAELKAIAELPMNWKGGDDNVVRGRLNKLVNRIKRLQKLKDGGIASYADHPDIQARLKSAVDRARPFGLFFVESGEVEDWVTHLMEDCPKVAGLSKLERAIIAAERIREAENKTGDVWAFVESVLKFLHLAKSDAVETAQ
jgi:Overcoming lysogenization defect protein-like, TOPRIM domain